MTSYPPNNDLPQPSTPIYEETVVNTETVVNSSEPPVSPPQGTTKNEAQDVAAHAKDAGQRVAGVAKDQAKGVASEAKGQAKQLLRDATSELKDQAATQQIRVASGLRSVGDELGSMAHTSDDGVASELVRNLSGRAESIASWLDERNPGTLLDEVKRFAARKPGTFIAIAAGAGILAGRLAKSLVAASSDDESSTKQTPPSAFGTGA